MPVLLSNISGNARWYLLNTVSDTTGTFQNHRYSRIFPLGHEPPLDFWFTQLFHFILIRNEEKERKKKIEVTNIETQEVTLYPSIGAAARALGYRQASLSLYIKENRTKPFKAKYLFKLVD